MTYYVKDICNYVIDYYNEKDCGVSNLKLQKLLYFIQAYFLVIKNERCFFEDIYAWDFGPVVPEAYRKYVMYGACNIYKKCSERDRIRMRMIDEDDKELINRVLDKFADYSSTQLVTLTQHQRPWMDAYIPYCQEKITVKAIKDFFSEDDSESQNEVDESDKNIIPGDEIVNPHGTTGIVTSLGTDSFGIYANVLWYNSEIKKLTVNQWYLSDASGNVKKTGRHLALV